MNAPSISPSGHPFVQQSSDQRTVPSCRSSRMQRSPLAVRPPTFRPAHLVCSSPVPALINPTQPGKVAKCCPVLPSAAQFSSALPAAQLMGGVCAMQQEHQSSDHPRIFLRSGPDSQGCGPCVRFKTVDASAHDLRMATHSLRVVCASSARRLRIVCATVILLSAQCPKF